MRRREMAVALLLAALSPATLAAQPQATDQLIKFFQSRVARDPDDVFSYNKLGAVYVQKARESGDLTYYALAEKAARRSTQLVPQGPSAAAATTLLALVHHARHEFPPPRSRRIRATTARSPAWRASAARSTGTWTPSTSTGRRWRPSRCRSTRPPSVMSRRSWASATRRASSMRSSNTSAR